MKLIKIVINLPTKLNSFHIKELEVTEKEKIYIYENQAFKDHKNQIKYSGYNESKYFRINKSELMQVQETLIKNDTFYISFQIYCLPENIEKAKELLYTEVRKLFLKKKQAFVVLTNSFEKVLTEIKV